MKRRFSFFLVILVSMVLSGCQEKSNADMILYNGIIYTVDKKFSVAEAAVVHKGVFIETGSSKQLKSHFRAKKKIDLKGQVVYPGFYDPYCHFSSYAENLNRKNNINSTTTNEANNQSIKHNNKHVEKLISVLDNPAQKANLLIAQEDCFAVGLTTVVDAGLDKEQVTLIDELQRAHELKIRVFAMLKPSDENLETYIYNGHYKTDHLNVRTVELIADGLLESREALLFEPYTDTFDISGHQVNSTEFMTRICKICYDNNFQVATRCIGDKANHLVLTIYKDILGGKNNRRWRIEYAQIIQPGDFHLFSDFSIVPSIQATQATSDMSWITDRIGQERIKGSCAYKQLLVQNGWLANGSDFPTESINPINTFFAGFARMDKSGFPKNGWLMENALSRVECLKAMTIWAARSCFEENERGSIEPGKMADFVILDQDIMTAEPLDVPKIKVMETWIEGERVYKRVTSNVK